MWVDFKLRKMDGQDWTIVTVKKSKRPPSSGCGQKIITPRVSGDRQAAAANARKLETTDFGKQRSLTAESRNEIVQRRVSLGKNQIQLNQDCRFPVNTIRDIENGKYCPNPGQLSMLNRMLKSSLKYDKS